jgi:hypothetical protein
MPPQEVSRVGVHTPGVERSAEDDSVVAREISYLRGRMKLDQEPLPQSVPAMLSATSCVEPRRLANATRTDRLM